MEAFLEQLKGVLDLEEIQPDSVLEDLPDWDSLAALSTIAMVGSAYDVNLPASALKGSLTVEGLYRMILEQKGR